MLVVAKKLTFSYSFSVSILSPQLLSNKKSNDSWRSIKLWTVDLFRLVLLQHPVSEEKDTNHQEEDDR